jgi:hypothetical protein
VAIDGHCHLGPYAVFWQPGNDAEGLVRTMDRIGVAQACVFSSLAIALDMRAGNDLTLAAARAHPNAHFVVAHAGAGLSPASFDLAQVAREEPNVYLDLTSSAGRFGAFQAMVEVAGADKLTYGSDMPWMCASYQIGRVLLARIPEDAKRRILGGTMAGLLATRR